MSLREMLSDYWYAFQQELFPRLENGGQQTWRVGWRSAEGDRFSTVIGLPCAPCLSSYILVMLCGDTSRERTNVHNPSRPGR